jgi:hypothetical protein
MKTILGISAALLATILLAGSVFAQVATTGYATVYCNDPSQCSTGNTCVNDACVAKTCGITAPGVDFGKMVPGATVGDCINLGQPCISSTVTNNGNTPTTSLEISGQNWIGSTSPWATPVPGINGDAWMPVGQTYWTLAGGQSWNVLTGIDASTGATVGAGSSTPVYFALVVPAQQPTDSYMQQITYTAGC